MKIAVIGAGAMGSLFGGLLSQAGNDVDLIDIAPAHVAAINDAGLRLDRPEGEQRIPVKAGPADAFSGTRDLLIVFTKGQHSRAAVESAVHLIGPETWALTVQNGLGNAEVIEAFVPRERIALGMTNYPADLHGPGHVSSHGSGEVRIWSATGHDDPRIAEICRTFNASGLVCVADPDVEVAIWEKVAFNAALNSIAAVTRATVGAMGRSEHARALAAAIVAETLAVARARGLGVGEERVQAGLAHAFAAHGEHKPSMLQDILAGRGTEIGTINGAILAAGRSAGVATPKTEALYDLVRLVEALPAQAA